MTIEELYKELDKVMDKGDTVKINLIAEQEVTS